MFRLLAQSNDVIEGVKVLIAEGGSYTIIGGAMIAAWRLTRRAANEAMAVREDAYKDALKQYEKERASWATERANLNAQLNEARGFKPSGAPKGGNTTE